MQDLFKFSLTVVLTWALFIAGAHATERGSAEEAIDLATRAASFIDEIGLDAARAEFESSGGNWHDRDLYVFVMDGEGKMLSHGVKASLIGRNLINLRDVDGRKFIQEFTQVPPGTSDWVNYKWQNPTNGKVEEKSSYIIRRADHLIGVGIYGSNR